MVTAVVRTALVMGSVAVILSSATITPARAAEIAVTDNRLIFTGTGPVDDILDIRPLDFLYEVYDGAGGLEVGNGCLRRTEWLAYCTSLVTEVRVDAGPGNDLVGLWSVPVPIVATGSEGDDFIELGTGSDRAEGGPGDDGLVGGEGDDWLAGDAGNDVIAGQGGADTLQGDAGDDVLSAQGGTRNVLLGGTGADLVRGGPGRDRLAGDSGDDALVANGRRDDLDGGQGRDQLFAGERDRLECDWGDRVHGQTGEPQRLCGRTRSRRRSARARSPGPQVWPPQPEHGESALASPSVLPPPDPKVGAVVRRPGAATRTTICIHSQFWANNVKVRVRTYTGRGHLVKAFKTIVDAHTCRTVSHPAPGRDALSAKARLPNQHW